MNVKKEAKKMIEEILLFRELKREVTDEQAFLELECLQDMLKMQELETLFKNSAYTKYGFLRKDSLLWNRLNDRLDLLIKDLIEFKFI